MAENTLLILDRNRQTYIAAYYYLIFGCTAIFAVAGFTYQVMIMLRKQVFSPAAVRMHKILVRSLIIQVKAIKGTVLGSFSATVSGLKTGQKTAENSRSRGLKVENNDTNST